MVATIKDLLETMLFEVFAIVPAVVILNFVKILASENLFSQFKND